MKDENFTEMSYDELQLFLMGFPEEKRKKIIEVAAQYGFSVVMLGEVIQKIYH